jgi:hypothetical protein
VLSFFRIFGYEAYPQHPRLGENVPARVPAQAILRKGPKEFEKPEKKPHTVSMCRWQLQKHPHTSISSWFLVHDGIMPNTWPELRFHGYGDQDRRQQGYKHQAEVYPSKSPHLIEKI